MLDISTSRLYFVFWALAARCYKTQCASSPLEIQHASRRHLTWQVTIQPGALSLSNTARYDDNRWSILIAWSIDLVTVIYLVKGRFGIKFNTVWFLIQNGFSMSFCVRTCLLLAHVTALVCHVTYSCERFYAPIRRIWCHVTECSVYEVAVAYTKMILIPPFCLDFRSFPA